MLKFGMRSQNGRIIIGVGLSAENVSRLQEGQPIYVPLEDWGDHSPFRGNLLICAGETEEALESELKDLAANLEEWSE